MGDLNLYGVNRDQLHSLLRSDYDNILRGHPNVFGFEKCSVNEGQDHCRYIRRSKNTFKSKFNRGNLIIGLNAWAVGVVRPSARIADWTKEKLLIRIERPERSWQ